MERTDRIYKKNDNSVKNSFKKQVVPLPRTRHSGDGKGIQGKWIQKMESAENEEEEEKIGKSNELFVNSRLMCTACHLKISSTNLGDNVHYDQTLVRSQRRLCHRCMQRHAIQSGSQNSPTCSRTSSNNPSLENIRSRIIASQEESIQQKHTEEIFANPRNRYFPSLPSAATRVPHYGGILRADSVTDWGTDYGESREDMIYKGKQFQQKSYCSIVRNDIPDSTVSEIRVNGQIVSECSRRPIRCPRLDCAMTVALSALTHHFLFDHPEVPILNVEPEAKTTLIVSFGALTYGSTKCLALLLVSGKLSDAAANLFNGNQIHSKYRNRLPLPVLAARLKSANQFGNQDEIKAGGEGYSQGDVIIAWVAGLDFSNSTSNTLRCSIQAVDSLESDGFRSLTYTGPINSLRTAQRPLEVFLAGDCVVLHESLVNQISSGCTSLIINVIVH